MAKLHNKAGQWGKRRAAGKFQLFFISGMLLTQIGGLRPMPIRRA